MLSMRCKALQSHYAHQLPVLQKIRPLLLKAYVEFVQLYSPLLEKVGQLLKENFALQTDESDIFHPREQNVYNLSCAKDAEE